MTAPVKLLPVTHDIADFVRDSQWSKLPTAVRAEAVRAFLNWVGVALGGASTPTVDTAVQGLSSFAPPGTSVVLGRPERFDAATAAMINCISSSAHVFDDTHLKSMTHPTGPIAATALAVAQRLKEQGRVVSGADLLHALVIGYEVECRISNAIIVEGAGASLGWYVTGVSGGIGAAAAAGRLLDLNHERLVYALGIAATQACGLRATHGSMAITFVPGVAARNGVTAAYLGGAGFTCGDISIDGLNGLLQLMSPNADVGYIRRGLGTEFELLNNAYKPYPCGIVIHPTIDACLQITRMDGYDADQIEHVDLLVDPDAMNLCWRKLPTNVLDAQVSVYHWAAAALMHKRAGLEEGELACVMEPAVRAVQQKTIAVVDPKMARDQGKATVRMKNGRVFEVNVEHAVGSIANPMTDAQLAEKFLGLAGRALSAERSRQLLSLCVNLGSAEEATEVARLAT